MSNQYSCVDAFCGAGGMSIGLARAGLDVLLGFDNDPICIDTLVHNPQYIKHETEVAAIDDMLNGNLLSALQIKKGELFLLVGGPPCQGFSIQRIGEDKDSRNNLVLKFIQLVAEVEPRYFLMENVAGITGKRGKEILNTAQTIGNELGYKVHFSLLDAQFFGVPQRRKRAFLVGELIQKNEKSTFEFPTPTNDRVFVEKVIKRLPPPPDDHTDHPDIPHHRRDKLSPLNLKRISYLKQGEGRDSLPEHLLANCHKISSDKIGHRKVYGRMKWEDVAPTITAKFDSFTRGQFGHPEQNRTISLREGALLQTFPEDYIFAGNKVEVARQIGNAVPPLLAQKIGEQILHSHHQKNVESQ